MYELIMFIRPKLFLHMHVDYAVCALSYDTS